MEDIISRIDSLLANTPPSEVEEFEVCRCLRDAKAEIEKLVGVAAFSSPEMVEWLTDQVMRRDNVIEAMKSAGMEQITKAFTENRWIPVGERLPEPHHHVIGWQPGFARTAEVWIGSNGQWLGGDFEPAGDITHWMSLPEPPPRAT